MEEIKIYVVGGDVDYASWIENGKVVDNLEDANIVLFTGGEDVDPSIYGKQRYAYTMSNLARDIEEKEIFEKIKPNQLALGICRGLKLRLTLNTVNCWNAEMLTSSQALMETLLKVQRLGIETKFFPMWKYVSNIPKSAVLINIIY